MMMMRVKGRAENEKGIAKMHVANAGENSSFSAPYCWLAQGSQQWEKWLSCSERMSVRFIQ